MRFMLLLHDECNYGRSILLPSLHRSQSLIGKLFPVIITPPARRRLMTPLASCNSLPLDLMHHSGSVIENFHKIAQISTYALDRKVGDSSDIPDNHEILKISFCKCSTSFQPGALIALASQIVHGHARRQLNRIQLQNSSLPSSLLA